MGDKALIYKQKFLKNLKECEIHFKRLNDSINILNLQYSFPLDKKSYSEIIQNLEYLAYADQIVYRFSKLQDTMGAKLFKSFLLYQGENVDIPFLDILNKLEKIDILTVEKWFELRELRNEISHNYDDDNDTVINILNFIYENIPFMDNILKKFRSYINE